MTDRNKINDIIELLEMAVETYDDEYGGTLDNGYTCTECLKDVKEILIDSVSSDSLKIPITNEDKLERLNLFVRLIAHSDDIEMQLIELIIKLRQENDNAGFSINHFIIEVGQVIKKTYLIAQGDDK